MPLGAVPPTSLRKDEQLIPFVNILSLLKSIYLRSLILRAKSLRSNFLNKKQLKLKLQPSLYISRVWNFQLWTSVLAIAAMEKKSVHQKPNRRRSRSKSKKRKIHGVLPHAHEANTSRAIASAEKLTKLKDTSFDVPVDQTLWYSIIKIFLVFSTS